jgi:hypothetical protein
MKRLLVLLVLLFSLLVANPVAAAVTKTDLAAHNMYLKGWFSYNKADYATALKVWEPLALQGFAQAQILLGTMYAKGQGVAQDHKVAIKWYKLAAEQGYADAQSNLGAIYDKGHEGVPRDHVRAHMWWNIAVLQGYEAARKSLDRVEEKMSSAQLETARGLAREWVQKYWK